MSKYVYNVSIFVCEYAGCYDIYMSNMSYAPVHTPTPIHIYIHTYTHLHIFTYTHTDNSIEQRLHALFTQGGTAQYRHALEGQSRTPNSFANRSRVDILGGKSWEGKGRK